MRICQSRTYGISIAAAALCLLLLLFAWSLPYQLQVLPGLSHRVAHSQKLLLYLGLFFFTVGLWNVGENDFSIFITRNPTLLYLMTFSGLFFIVAPLYGFALQAITFRWHRLLTAVMYISFTAATLALLLQLTGIYMLSQSLYWFHVLHISSLTLLTVALVYEAIHERNRHARWMLIPIGCLFATALLELVNYHFFHWFEFSLGFLSGTILFLFLMLVITAAIIRRNARLQENYRAQQHTSEMLGVRLKAEKTRHDLILQEEQRLAKLRHDMKHHVALVASLAAEGNLARIQSHMAELTDALQSATPRHWCENLAVNAITEYYAALAQAEGYDVTIDIECPEHAGGLTDAELASVFGNLLENALEACRRAVANDSATGQPPAASPATTGTDPEAPKTAAVPFIRLKARLLNGHLVIVQDNTLATPPKRNGAAYISSKRDGRQIGLGLRSLADIAAAHGGHAEFSYDAEAFHSSVIMEL